MDPSCFVHIGAPKTGSTFLQKTLFENRGALQGAGLLYPSTATRAFGHHDIAFLLSGGYPDWATPQEKPLQQLLDETAGDLAGHDGDVLFSSEDFYLFPEPERLKAFLAESGALAGRQARIVVYVRPQDEAIEAWYNQAVKAQGEARPIEEAAPDYHELWDYRAALRPWADAFGEAAIMVRRYRPPGDPDGSLMEDFLAALGRPGLRLALTGAGVVNPRENRDVLEFQRRLNQLPLSPQKKRRFFRELAQLSESSRGSGLFDERPLLDAPARRRIARSYADSNADVARRYLGADSLFEPRDEPGGDPTPAAPEGLTVDKLVYILGWILATAG